MRQVVFYSLFCIVSVLGSAPPCPAQVTDEDVTRSIEAMKVFLYSQQNADGSWEPATETRGAPRQNNGGVTALVTLSLLLSGESAQSPKMERAIAWLREYNLDNGGLYAISVRAHVWAQLNKSHRALLAADARRLLDNAELHEDKLFRYTRFHDGPTDLSLGQYGILGLWEAAKREIAVPVSVWKRHLDYLLETQNDDGGWGYSRERSKSSGSMTCAGLTVLYIIQQQVYRYHKTPDPRIAVAIERGLIWMNKRFTAERNPGEAWEGWEYYYYLYCVERVGLAGGIKSFGGVDWYKQIAQVIVRQVKEKGSVPVGNRLTTEPAINTAFALMFLARGRYPIMMAKLRIPKARWNERPMDLHFFSQYLSDTREAELNWQVIDVDSDPYEWINSPILTLSSPDKLELTDKQKQNLKTYLDLGGTLVCSPDEASSAFLKSARALAAELYPDYPAKALDEKDAIFDGLPVGPGGMEPVQVVSSGARNLIYIASTDWAYEFQSGKNYGTSPPWRLMTNIWASATNRGVLPGRLTQYVVARKSGNPSANVTVNRVKYKGQWDPEPLAWSMAANHIFNRSTAQVDLKTVELERLLDSPKLAPLTHMAVTEAVELTDVQLAVLKRYVSAGGTLLIENVGGTNSFARLLANQIARKWETRVEGMVASHPILTGQGLSGGYDNATVSYRRYASLKLGLTQPRLAVISVGGRPAVILASEDLSLGALGSTHWHILGYDRDSARQILTNIVLWAAAQKITPLK